MIDQQQRDQSDSRNNHCARERSKLSLRMISIHGISAALPRLSGNKVAAPPEVPKTLPNALRPQPVWWPEPLLIGKPAYFSAVSAFL
jgi:hypothetical protein